MKQYKEDLNFKRLVEMAGSDETFIREMLVLFCKNTESLMLELNASFQKGEFIEISSLAHKLKSSMQIVADVELHTLVKKIELEAKSTTEKHQIKRRIDELNDSISNLVKAIEKRLENPTKFN